MIKVELKVNKPRLRVYNRLAGEVELMSAEEFLKKYGL